MFTSVYGKLLFDLLLCLTIGMIQDPMYNFSNNMTKCQVRKFIRADKSHGEN